MVHSTASQQVMLAPFSTENLTISSSGAAISYAQGCELSQEALRHLASRHAKTVASSTPLPRSSKEPSGEGPSGGEPNGKGLKLPIDLKGIGEETLMDYSTPEIRRTAAARLEEYPADAKWFRSVNIETSSKKEVADSLWRAAKKRWPAKPKAPPATESPATEPPATEPPATEPPATEPPATEPPATEPPATEPPATEPARTPAPAPAPAADPGDASALAAAQQQLAQLQAQLQAFQAQAQAQAAQAHSAQAHTAQPQQIGQPQQTAQPPQTPQATVHGSEDITSPPGDVRAIQKRLAGLRRAQIRTCTDEREEQIGELEFELSERQRKFKKYGHW
eukprot:729287-Prymnesium_polylepis.1